MKLKGGQRKHWSDTAKVKIWYKLVSMRTGISDYELNLRFAWSPAHKPKDSAERIRAFEWMRKKGREPQGRDLRWRSMKQIVDAVEAEPNLKGIKEIYEASFWDTVKLSSMSLTAIRSRVASMLDRFSLNRIDKKFDLSLREALEDFNEISLYSRHLEITLFSMDDLIALEFCWLLYQESRCVNSNVTSVLESILDKKLNDYFDLYIGEFTNNTYYINAVNSMRLVNVYKSQSNLSKLDKYKRECLMPIVRFNN